MIATGPTGCDRIQSDSGLFSAIRACARLLHYAPSVRISLRVLLASLITVWMFGPSVGARAAGDAAGPDVAALREMLEGTTGRREAWSHAPELVVLTSVMHYVNTDVRAEQVATGERLSSSELRELVTDLTAALGVFTAGRIEQFSAVKAESLAAGQATNMLRKGQIVVGRFRGFQARSGTLGYGGRMVRQGAIAAGVVMLDRDFDRQAKERELLRTHELGHALGYNHVQSRKSVMNPRVGVHVTDFDRQAGEVAYGGLGAPLSSLFAARN
jgi:hypothetical protein